MNGTTNGITDSTGILDDFVLELEAHLLKLKEDIQLPLDPQLFDAVSLQLNESNVSPLIPRLLPSLIEVLSRYPGNPTAIASLAVKFLTPLNFRQVLQLATADSLIESISSPSPAVSLLGITVLEKAARNPADTALLAETLPAVLVAFIVKWLSTPSVEVGEKATKVLGDLLDADCDRRTIEKRMDGIEITLQRKPGQGLLWQRIFNEEDTYKLIFEACSLRDLDNAILQLDPRQRSLAQARLLRLLPRLVPLNFRAITRSEFPHVEALFGMDNNTGLLWFAGVNMVDKDEDILMHATLVDFFVEFIKAVSETDIGVPGLTYLSKLLKAALETDEPLKRNLEGISTDPNSEPELVGLIARLTQA